jgi:hypothetical protein
VPVGSRVEQPAHSRVPLAGVTPFPNAPFLPTFALHVRHARQNPKYR